MIEKLRPCDGCLVPSSHHFHFFRLGYSSGITYSRILRFDGAGKLIPYNWDENSLAAGKCPNLSFLCRSGVL